MALDIDRIAEAAEDEAVDLLKDAYGEENIDEDEARKGLAPIVKAIAKAMVEELQSNAVVTVPNVTAGVDTATGSIS